MRVAQILLVVSIIMVVCGCEECYDWIDVECGTISSISGFSDNIVFEFDGGGSYKIPAKCMEDSSDAWAIGDMVILQQRLLMSNGCVTWRIKSPKIAKGESFRPIEKQQDF